jgi:4-hydroxybenzoate polyprenyltransferase
LSSSAPSFEADGSTDQVWPLVVDMDDTLLCTDTLLESALQLVRHQVWCLLLLPFWLMGGRAHLKRRISEHATLDIATLPVNAPLLAWLLRQHKAGRALHLFSAADQSIVTAVATRFGIFQSAHGSDGIVNLSGTRKLAAIRAIVGSRFTYAGDSRKDLPIWRGGGSAVLVGAIAPLRAELGADVTVEADFAATRPGVRTWMRALRLHQWAKNILLFVAVLLGGDVLTDLPAALIGFLVFGLMASATYLLNDMLDLPHDRLHRSKRHRPLASGALPLRQAVVAVVLLGLAAAALLPLLPLAFAWVAALYLAVTLTYSAYIKRKLMLDVFTLAGLFAIRIVAGIAAVNHPLTPWLMAFSIFFFLSLACVKRYSECLVAGEQGLTTVPGRAYLPKDAPWLMAMGAASGFSAVSTFFLFLVDTGSPILLYPHPRWMWLICILLGYWICRTWALAARGQMHDDPILFAMRDRLSLILGGVIAVLVLLARS